MINILVNVLGSLGQGKLKFPATLAFAEGSTVSDLIDMLNTLGLNSGTNEIIISLDGRGILQFPPERLLQAGDEVMVFQNIAGG